MELSREALSSSYAEAEFMVLVNQVFAWDEVVWASTYGLFRVPAPLDLGQALSKNSPKEPSFYSLVDNHKIL